MEKEIQISYIEHDSWEDLSLEDKELVNAANEARENAYAPYSKFNVGAAIRLSDGTLVLGSNQENIAYPSGLCAERVALFAAGANYPGNSVDVICIVAKGDLVPTETTLSPCGACRQVMVETERRQEKPYKVILVSQNGKTIIFNKAHDLLPLAFGVE